MTKDKINDIDQAYNELLRESAFKGIKIDGLFDITGKQICEGDILKNTYKEVDNNGNMIKLSFEDEPDIYEVVDYYICKWEPKCSSFVFKSFEKVYLSDPVLNTYTLQDEWACVEDYVFRLNFQKKHCMDETTIYETVIIGNIYNPVDLANLKDLNKKYIEV